MKAECERERSQSLSFWLEKSKCACACMLNCSVVSNSFVSPCAMAHQASLSVGVSRQKYWSGLPCPPPGDLSDTGIKPASPGSPALAGDSLPLVPSGKPRREVSMGWSISWDRKSGVWQTLCKFWGFPGSTSGKEPTCQCWRHKRCWFDPWVGMIPWRSSWQPSPVFLPGESPWTEEPCGLQSIGLQRVGHDGRDGLRACTCLSFKWLWVICIRNVELFHSQNWHVFQKVDQKSVSPF